MRWVGFLRRLLTTDFCPWANRFVYWVKRPAACLTLASGVSLIFAILLKPIAWVVFAGLIFVLGFGLIWPWLAVRGISTEVIFPTKPVTEGESVRISLAITNRWPWPVWGLCLENLLAVESPQLSNTETPDGPFEDQVALARVSGWSCSTFHWTLTPGSRGIYPKEVPQIATAFPFGLWICRRQVSVSNTLVVWPKTFPVETLLDAHEALPSADCFSDCLTGELGDLVGTRSYREGDSLRRVHWAQTARHDRLIVCERQASVLSNVELIADVSPEVHSGNGPDGSLEWTIRIFASLAKAWHAEHALVTCRWGCHSLVVHPGMAGIRRLFDALARIPSEGEDSECDSGLYPASGSGLQIRVTTDRGLSRQSLPVTSKNHRQIVLGSPRLSGQPVSSNPVPFELKNTILLDGTDQIAQGFQEQWRGVCHAG